MSQQNYQCSIIVHASTDEAFYAITHSVADWWTNSFRGASQKTGDEFSVRFGDTFCDFRITEVVPGKKVVWLTTECNLEFVKDKKEWKGTTLHWEVSPHKEGARIDMTHEGLVPEVECYDNCKKGWDFYIKESLFKLLNEGNGQPDVPKKNQQTQA